jgi:sulfoxide reductase heme-binding subunit YedZ
MFLTLFVLVGLSPEHWVDIPDRKADSLLWRTSISLAYTALLFLAAILAIGPFNVIRGRPNPANNMLRRDIGFWAGGVGLAHMALGMLVHTDGWQIWTLFFHSLPGLGDLMPLHKSFFGLANYTGAFQSVLLVALILVSSNRMLRRLGTRRWKSIQRLSYLAAVSIAVHGISYQIVERRYPVIQAFFVAVILVVLSLQLTGFAIRKSREVRKPVEMDMRGE